MEKSALRSDYKNSSDAKYKLGDSSNNNQSDDKYDETKIMLNSESTCNSQKTTISKNKKSRFKSKIKKFLIFTIGLISGALIYKIYKRLFDKIPIKVTKCDPPLDKLVFYKQLERSMNPDLIKSEGFVLQKEEHDLTGTLTDYQIFTNYESVNIVSIHSYTWYQNIKPSTVAQLFAYKPLLMMLQWDKSFKFETLDEGEKSDGINTIYNGTFEHPKIIKEDFDRFGMYHVDRLSKQLHIFGKFHKDAQNRKIIVKCERGLGGFADDDKYKSPKAKGTDRTYYRTLCMSYIPTKNGTLIHSYGRSVTDTYIPEFAIPMIVSKTLDFNTKIGKKFKEYQEDDTLIKPQDEWTLPETNLITVDESWNDSTLENEYKSCSSGNGNEIKVPESKVYEVMDKVVEFGKSLMIPKEKVDALIKISIDPTKIPDYKFDESQSAFKDLKAERINNLKIENKNDLFSEDIFGKDDSEDYPYEDYDYT